MRINQLYPHAPANLEEVKEILGERWIKDGDVCFSRAQIDKMNLTDQMSLEILATREYGRRK